MLWFHKWLFLDLIAITFVCPNSLIKYVCLPLCLRKSSRDIWGVCLLFLPLHIGLGAQLWRDSSCFISFGTCAFLFHIPPTYVYKWPRKKEARHHGNWMREKGFDSFKFLVNCSVQNMYIISNIIIYVYIYVHTCTHLGIYWSLLILLGTLVCYLRASL